MRAVLLAVLLVLAAGCGKRAEPTEATEPVRPGAAPNSDEPKGGAPKDDGGPPIEADTAVIVKQYADNPLAADRDYLGKRLVFTTSAQVIGKSKGGELFIGKNYVDSAVVEPSLLFIFPKSREGELAGLKKRDTVTIVGVCRGRVDDGISRVFKGLEFHVRLDDCRLVEDAKSLGPKK